MATIDEIQNNNAKQDNDIKNLNDNDAKQDTKINTLDTKVAELKAPKPTEILNEFGEDSKPYTIDAPKDVYKLIKGSKYSITNGKEHKKVTGGQHTEISGDKYTKTYGDSVSYTHGHSFKAILGTDETIAFSASAKQVAGLSTNTFFGIKHDTTVGLDMKVGLTNYVTISPYKTDFIGVKFENNAQKYGITGSEIISALFRFSGLASEKKMTMEQIEAVGTSSTAIVSQQEVIASRAQMEGYNDTLQGLTNEISSLKQQLTIMDQKMATIDSHTAAIKKQDAAIMNNNAAIHYTNVTLNNALSAMHVFN